MTAAEQAAFNFRMYRLVGRTICEYFYEVFGNALKRGPKLSAIRNIISLTERYGIPNTEREVILLVRHVCREHGLPSLGRN